MSEKKCPYCGKWTDWTQKLEDACQHCGKPLGETYLREQEERTKRDAEGTDFLFDLHEGDGALVTFFKKVANLFYFVFMLIIGFIVWLIAVLPG